MSSNWLESVDLVLLFCELDVLLAGLLPPRAVEVAPLLLQHMTRVIMVVYVCVPDRLFLVRLTH